jgi:prophage antirepressor-like protein
MQATAKAHDSELKSESIANMVNMKAVTSQNKTEIDAIVKMLIANLDTSALKAEMDRRNAEQLAFAQQAVSDIDEEQNPLMNQQPMQQPQQPMEQAPMEQQPQPPMQGM